MVNIQTVNNFNFTNAAPKDEIKDAILSCSTHDKSHTIAVDFLLGEGRKERVIFTSLPTDASDPSPYGTYLSNVSASKICLDMQPINGVAKARFVKNLFRNSHVQDFNAQISFIVDYLESKATKVFVLDIKDSKGLYEHEGEIEKSEKEVVDFALAPRPREKSPRQDIYDILKQQEISFVFLEGKLKNRVITRIVNKQQAAFLQKTPRGREILCMVCEMVMNLFKKGYDVAAPISEGEMDAHHYTLAAEEFVAPLAQVNVLAAQKVGDVSLVTLYPRHYKALYGPDEQYYKSVSAISDAKHTYDDSTGTTAITIK